MDNIENLIRNNKGFFEEAEPDAGHFDRFSTKLELRFNLRKKVSIAPYILKAAVVTILVTLSSLWTWDHFLNPARNRMTLSEVSSEYKEVERYYVQQTSIMENEIFDINFENNEEQKAILKEELRNMDMTYKDLQRELKANPNDERVINAMIEHYQTKLDVMSYILSQLKEAKESIQNSNDSHEEVSI